MLPRHCFQPARKCRRETAPADAEARNRNAEIPRCSSREDWNEGEPLVPTRGHDLFENRTPLADAARDVFLAIARALQADRLVHDDGVTAATVTRDEERIDRDLRDQRQHERPVR